MPLLPAVSVLFFLFAAVFPPVVIKRPAPVPPAPKTNILGMILLENTGKPNFTQIADTLRARWQLDARRIASGTDATFLILDGYTAAIAYMPFPIPGDAVAQTAACNYFWENGATEAPLHKAHIILSIKDAGEDPIAENILFTKLADAVLRSTPATGIYLGDRTLALPKDFYLDHADNLQTGELPLLNWIYFGFRKHKNRFSAFTYGMQDFGKHNLEILESHHSPDDIHTVLYNAAHFMLASDTDLMPGKKIAVSDKQHCKVNLSEGRHLKEETLKIEY